MFGTVNWSASTIYSKYDTVMYAGRFFVCIKDNVIGDVPQYQDLNLNSNFNFLSWNPENYFFWTPTYSTNIQKDSTAEKLELGDGYSKRFPIGLNNTFNAVNLIFNNLSDKESQSMLAFLQNAGGYPFIFTVPFPYSKAFWFICINYSHSKNRGFNSISATFNETFKQVRPKFTLAEQSPLI